MPDVTLTNEVHVTAVVLDDDSADLDLVATLQAGDFDIITMTPEPTLENTADRVVSTLEPAAAPLVLADYRLDVPDEVRFRGGSVALAVKDARPAIPVVLITSDANMHAFLSARPSARAAFDWTLLKDRLVDETQIPGIRRQLRSLAGGNAWIHRLGEAAVVDEHHGAEVLREAIVPPEGQLVQEVESWFAAQGSMAPAELATWMLEEFLPSPSPLVDAHEGAAIVGLTGAAFQEIASVPEVENARYRGIFAGLEQRWWRSPLLRLAEIAEREGDGDRAQGFVRLGRATTVPEGAACPWCAGPVSRSCAVCKRGCDEAHALPLARAVPPWSMPLVVCYECIAAGRDVEGGHHVDPGATELAHEIRTGRLSPPTY